MKKAIGCGIWLTLAAGIVAYAAEGPPQLHGRIVSKEGVQNARVWTFEVRNGGTTAVSGAQIDGLRLMPDAPQACTPVVKEPAGFPLPLGDLAAGATAQAKVTIDFSGCANTAKFRVHVRLAGSGGAWGAIRRSNNYR